MNTKSLFLLASLIILSSFKPIQQIDDTQLYQVIIFKWVKNGKGEDKQKAVIINQDGKITLNNKISDKKINIKSFTKAVNNFIKAEKLVKEEANNDPPKAAIIPKNGEQSISLTIIKLIDFNNEKDFENNSQYSYRKIKKLSDVNIDLYKYLQADDLATLKKKLE